MLIVSNLAILSIKLLFVGSSVASNLGEACSYDLQWHQISMRHVRTIFSGIKSRWGMFVWSSVASNLDEACSHDLQWHQILMRHVRKIFSGIKSQRGMFVRSSVASNLDEACSYDLQCHQISMRHVRTELHHSVMTMSKWSPSYIQLGLKPLNRTKFSIGWESVVWTFI